MRFDTRWCGKPKGRKRPSFASLTAGKIKAATGKAIKRRPVQNRGLMAGGKSMWKAIRGMGRR